MYPYRSRGPNCFWLIRCYAVTLRLHLHYILHRCHIFPHRSKYQLETIAPAHSITHIGNQSVRHHCVMHRLCTQCQRLNAYENCPIPIHASKATLIWTNQWNHHILSENAFLEGTLMILPEALYEPQTMWTLGHSKNKVYGMVRKLLQKTIQFWVSIFLE